MLLLEAVSSGNVRLSESETYYASRGTTYVLMNVFGIKMAGVFMLTASTMILRTKFTARWCAFAGYLAAATILIGSQFLSWALFLFPIWVLLVSLNILVEEFRRPVETMETPTATAP